MNINLLKKPIKLSAGQTKFFEKLGGLPQWKERLYLTLPSLMLKPTVDYFVNRDLDQQTRTYSAGKAFTQVAVGGTSGILTRLMGERVGTNLHKHPKGLTYIKKYTAKNILPIIATIAAIYTIEIPFISKALDVITDKFKPKNTDSQGVNKNAKSS